MLKHAVFLVNEILRAEYIENISPIISLEPKWPLFGLENALFLRIDLQR